VTGLRERVPLSRKLICRRMEDIVISFQFEGSAGECWVEGWVLILEEIEGKGAVTATGCPAQSPMVSLAGSVAARTTGYRANLEKVCRAPQSWTCGWSRCVAQTKVLTHVSFHGVTERL
jgi:hypothetical protein